MKGTDFAGFPALTFALLLAGCVGSTAESCSTVDWYRQGYADGSRTPWPLIDEHSTRCGAFGVKPDAARYQEGWAQARWDVEHRFK